jgi:hypothetical protein
VPSLDKKGNEMTDNTSLTEPLPDNKIEKWVNRSYTLTVIGMVALSALYAFSPIDAIPDLIPVAGQVDDLATLLAGGGSVGFLTAVRFAFLEILKRPRMRVGCLTLFVLSSVVLVGGGVLVFIGLMSLLS